MKRLNRKQKLTRKLIVNKNPKTLKKLAIAFAIVIAAVGIYAKFLAPYTLEAKQRVQLESIQKEAIQVREKLQHEQAKSAEEDALKQKKIEEKDKQIEELNKQIQAKANVKKAYAASLADPKGNCEQWKAAAGIPSTNATRKLINNESGCRPNAVNPSSGACGIPQAWPCSKLPCTLQDPVCQLKWMDSYVKGRYGSWDNALSMWYSRCGSKQGCWY